MNIITGRRAIAKLLIVIAVLLALGALVLVGDDKMASASASGPSPSHTNAPGESSCINCHGDFELNSGPGSVVISGIPSNYLPGQEVAITVTTSQEDAVVYGFQMTAIDSQGSAVGTFTLPVEDPARMQVLPGIVEGNERLYVEHTIAGLFTPGQFGSNSWTFKWTAPAARVGKIGFYAAGNAANSDESPSGDYIYTDSDASLSGSAISNFDGDLRSDIAVFRPATGTWYSYTIATGDYQSFQFGTQGDVITPGDYDGDGTTDFAVFRPSTGAWYIQQSGGSGFIGVHFGTAGDQPVAGDYDGDGKTDIAVFRPSTGFWYLWMTSLGIDAVNFGLDGDKPVPGDFDADGRTDIAVYRPSTGIWYLLQSSAGITATHFGIEEDDPVQADYDGDGKTDVAVYRPSSGQWYLLRSRDGFFGTSFGLSTDRPAPADYDGDGKTDIAVYRPSSGTWYVLMSADNTFYATVFGTDGDIPVAAGYLTQ